MPPDKTDPPLRFKKMRIAWSVFCGLAAVLLGALWVRTQYLADNISGPLLGKGFAIASRNGGTAIRLPNGQPPSKWHLKHLNVGPSDQDGYSRVLGFGINRRMPAIFIPYWFTVLSSVLLAMVSWVHLPKRFALRTLLIATTLVAVVLGLAVWAAAK